MKKIIAIIIGLMFALWVGQGLMVVPNDPMYGLQPALVTIKAEGAWTYETGGTTQVAVVGTGLGFNGVIPPDIIGTVVVTSDATSPDDNYPNLGVSTPSSAIITATGNNSLGITGVMWQSTLRVYKTHREDPHLNQVTDEDTAEAINAAVTWGAQVIQLDFAFIDPRPLTLIAVNNAINLDRIVVIGVGSFGGGLGYLPLNAAPELLTVAAGDIYGNPMGYDGEGPQLDLTAPGNGVFSISSSGSYTTFTQGATAPAFVSGVAGLLRDRQIGEYNTRRALTGSTTDLLPAGFDNATGWGLLNAKCAMAIAGDMTGDKVTDIRDAVFITGHYGEPAIDTPQNVDNLGVVDVRDAIIDVALFGANCT